jgi:pseudouridine-5'-phosphate glycosidase
VEAALDSGLPVVALESTIFSRLGLPEPAGAEALERCLLAVAEAGAVPAVTAVLDGVARVGLDDEEHERVVAATAKVASRDLPVALAQAWPAGATTVSASLALAARAGIRVFATGGIGGVHRQADASGDVSADLDALARHPVVTVCAGVKGFLDVGRTLEALEALGVPVLGLGTGEFPAFLSGRSGLPVTEAGSEAEVARVVEAARSLGYGGGVLLAVPVPTEHELPPEDLDPVIDAALSEAAGAGVRGPALTPFVLERIAVLTGGRSVATNVALAENNARVAASVAAALSSAGG